MNSSLPVVDLAEWRRSAPGDRRRIERDLDDALRELGFLHVVGHGLTDGAVQAVLAAADGFFELDEAEKLTYRPPNPGINRGYAPIGSEALAYSLGHDGPPDLFAAFNIGPEGWPEGNPVYEAERDGVFAANLWPARPSAFQTAVTAYFVAAAAVARELLCLFACALGLDEHHFEPYTDHSTDTLRMNYYRLGPGEPEPGQGQRWMGAHTDYGILTVLLADQVPGLEILDDSGGWRSVRPFAEGIVVNLGDLLAQWTNDRWRSTVHRVVTPLRSTESTVRRRSLAFFHDGNYDATISCLPTCADAGHPARYQPVVAGEHIRAKLLGPRTMTASTAASTLDDRL